MGLMELIRRISRLQLGLYGANVCYFLVLSLFPGLVLVLVCLRFTPLSAMDLIHLLEGLIPESLMGSVETLIVNAYYNTGGAMVSLSAVAALWSSSRSVYGLMDGLNRVYGVRESRGYLRKRLISAAYMALFPGVLVLTLGLHVFGNQLVAWLQWQGWIPDLRLAVLVTIQSLVFALMYMVLPGRPNRFLDSLPGALGAALGWQLFSQLFGVYMSRSGEYGRIYGPVYALAPGMLWLYCCTVILLLGGLLNRLLAEQK